MIKKIYTYGDSFSYPFWIENNETYTHILSKILNVDNVNNSFPALCNDEIYHRLLNDINLFEINDLIIYQFTTGHREGFMLKNHTFYYSTAGLYDTIDETINVMNLWGGGRENYPMTNEQLLILLDYINNWGEHTLYHKYHRAHNLLSYIEKKIGCKFVFLFLDASFTAFIDGKTLLFDKTPSIMEFINKYKLRLVDDTVDGNHPMDTHPNVEGHKQIASRIHDYLIENNYI